MKKYVRYISVATASISIMVSSLLLTGCEKSSDVKVDIYEYFGMIDYADESHTQGTKAPADQAAVVGEGEISPYRAVVKDGKAYVNIDAIQEYVDRRFYWDSKEGYVMFTNATDVYQSRIGENEVVCNGKAEQLDDTVAYVQGEDCYLSMVYVDRFADTDYQLHTETDERPATVTIQYKAGNYITYSTKRNCKMRVEEDLMSNIVTEVKKGDRVTIIEEGKEWAYVQTEDGFIGYIQIKHLEDKKENTVTRKNDDSTYTHNTLDEKISLVWHQVTNEVANGTLHSMTSEMDGVNVISPTWITIADAKGNIQEISSVSYVNDAHAMGLKVWVLADDFTTDSKGNKLVNKVLISTSKREALEENLLNTIESCGADGINIDYEYISFESSESYMQFLREMHIKCKERGITLTVDNYVPSEWSKYYDLEQQGKLADYLMVMSYDEHTAGSDIAGPVASLPFAKKGVEDTIEKVGDASRVIMGIPLYTRIWTETPEEYVKDGDKIIEDSVNGNYALSSQACGMDTTKEFYESFDAEPVWDEEKGLNYVFIEGEHENYQIWIEDTKSIKAKLDVADELGAGGCACWKLGFENKPIWKIIKNYSKK